MNAVMHMRAIDASLIHASLIQLSNSVHAKSPVFFTGAGYAVFPFRPLSIMRGVERREALPFSSRAAHLSVRGRLSALHPKLFRTLGNLRHP